MTPTADDVRELARTAPARWTSLHLEHRSTWAPDVEAWLRHGELTTRDDRGRVTREVGPPPTSWTVRDLEPIHQSYAWAAMLDPYELSESVEFTDVRTDVRHERPVLAFRAVALDGYDPICSCCPLVLSEISERLEHGEDWTPPAGVALPSATDLALDRETGIVVSCVPVDGTVDSGFTNRILEAT